MEGVPDKDFFKGKQSDMNTMAIHMKLLFNLGLLLYLLHEFSVGIKVHETPVSWSCLYAVLGILSAIYSYESVREYCNSKMGLVIPDNI